MSVFYEKRILTAILSDNTFERVSFLRGQLLGWHEVELCLLEEKGLVSDYRAWGRECAYDHRQKLLHNQIDAKKAVTVGITLLDDRLPLLRCGITRWSWREQGRQS